MENIKFHIIPDFSFRNGVKIYETTEINGIPYHKPDIKKVFEPHEEGSEITPCMLLRGEELEALLKALIEFAETHNVKIEKEDHLKGRMEATEKHLQEISAINEGNMALITKLIGKIK